MIVEADNSFRAKDLGKFLEYLKRLRHGDRNQDYPSDDRARGEYGRVPFAGGTSWWENLVEALWWGQEPRFTDVGCTYRAIWKDAYYAISEENLIGVGPEFSPEMMIEALRARKRVIEIPISYYPRLTGESKHSESYYHIARTALKDAKTYFQKTVFWMSQRHLQTTLLYHSKKRFIIGLQGHCAV